MITTRLMYGLVGAVGCFLFIAAKVLVPHWSVFSVLGSKARATFLTDLQIQVLVCGRRFMSLFGTFITLMYFDARPSIGSLSKRSV